jgi:hypothetical protein
MMKLLTWNYFFTFNYSKRLKQNSSLLANHLTIQLNLGTLSVHDGIRDCHLTKTTFCDEQKKGSLDVSAQIRNI